MWAAVFLLALAALPAQAQPADWTARLPAFGAALRGCLEDAPGAFADYAARQQAFAVAVRVRHGRETELCIARPDGRVLRRGPVGDAPPVDPAAPAFFLDRHCADARRQEDDSGQLLGWLAYPGC